MTKDRRLGKGLAALLGTPLEEDTIVDGTASGPESSMSLPAQSAAGKPLTKSAQSRLAKPPTQQTSSSGSSNTVATPPATLERSQPTSSKSEVTGSVPLSQFQKPTSGAVELSVYDIDNNPFQPRRKFNEDEIASLAESIREHEQLQPILVRKVGQRYQLISGERRLRATIHAGLTKIRAEIREADDRLVAELAIVENLQRKDLDAIEKALSFRRYIDEHKCKQDDLAKRLKIDRSTIANLMRLLELPTGIQQWVQAEKITAGHARALLPLGEEDQQLDFARKIIEEGWSVRETERRVAEQLDAEDSFLGGKSSKNKTKNRISPQVASLEKQLRLALGTKTEIRQNARGRGKISITFSNPEEFDRICALICPEIEKKAA